MSPPPPTPRTATRDLSALRIDSADRQPEAARRLPWVIVTAVVLLGLLAVLLPRLLDSAALRPRVRVGLASLDRPGPAALALLSGSGYVVPRVKASVSAKRAGRLALVAVEEGDRVEAGALLARLENADLEAQVAARRAQLAEREAAHARSIAEEDIARVEARRQDRLLEAEVGTASSAETAQARLRAAEAAKAEALAAVASAKAQLRLAEVDLADADVLAPFTGVILRREAEAGESVAPAIAAGQSTRGAIVTMADLDSLEVEIDVTEANVPKTPVGTPAEISLDAVPDRRYRGRVRQVLPTADRSKATVQVTVELLDADPRIKPEMGARVTFLAAEPEQLVLDATPVVTAPAEAIVTKGTVTHVLVVESGTLSQRAVRLGERIGTRIVIVDGLAGGETLVLAPAADLAPGDRVRLEGIE